MEFSGSSLWFQQNEAIIGTVYQALRGGLLEIVWYVFFGCIFEHEKNSCTIFILKNDGINVEKGVFFGVGIGGTHSLTPR